MKVVGLCKTFSCSEFMPAVMAPLYHMLDGIVFVHSNVDWTGKRGFNEVEPFTNAYPDPLEKVHQVYTSTSSQDEQYEQGIDYILKNFPDADWIFLFDTDEVWHTQDLLELFAHADACTYENALFCRMYTYIKSPFYRIDPPEPLTPCVMFRALPGLFRGTRGNAVGPIRLVDVYFHHFSYVRACEQDVFRKIVTSHAGDKLQPINIEKWREEKWNRLPYAKDFHTTCGYEKNWHSVKVIKSEELPEAVLGLPFIQNSLKQDEGLEE